MSRKHYVSALPEADRRQSIADFLSVFERHPNLAHFRTRVRTGPERQLALFAALERFVLVGSPAVSPPSPDDEADQLLCDLLDVINSHPRLKGHGSAYGADRHVANLQAFGVWRGRAPISQPSARELFTTTFSHLTGDAPTALPSSDPNYSPAPQDVAPHGELIGLSQATHSPVADSPSSPQTLDGVLVVSIAPNEDITVQTSEPTGIIHHADQNPGEQLVGWAVPTTVPPSESIPPRPIRRGRPFKLDDLAKGRVLGLMSHGLSFRQAAAQLGVHHVTLLNAMKRDEEFAQQVSEARLDAISQPLLTVVEASRKNWRAAAWLAKFLEDRRTRAYEYTPEEYELARNRN